MRKIGLITILKVNNYGAELQAFALHRTLLNLNIDNEIIDYLYYTNPNHQPSAHSARIVHLSIKNRLKWEGHKLIYLLNKFRTKMNDKELKFNEFNRKNIKSSKTYKSYEDLYSANLDYDTFIVGSDQVWNPITHTSIKPYFLTFVKDGKKKISYASSFGVSQIERKNINIYKELINNIDILSCREQVGVQIIKDITGREATHVLDPTLLLTQHEWSLLAIENSIFEPYILLYVLRYSSYIQKLTNHLIEHYKIKVINIGATIKDKHIQNISDAGPSEFIGYFKNATFVLTDSYHGTIFSVIFQKPFFTIVPSRKSNNSRQKGLLELLTLQSRLLNEDDKLPTRADFDIDFNNSNTIIIRERQNSINYLLDAIR